MAGEIQLNSTTFATESSGSITAELDTIRPNATNGSLTLQGDSSNAGVTGLTIDSSGNATFAQTISGGTIGSGVVFPAGVIRGVAILTEEYASGSYGTAITTGDFRTRNLNTTRYNGDSVVSSFSGGAFTLPAGSYFFNAIVHNYGTRESVSRIYNTSDSVEVARGLMSFSVNSECQSDVVGHVTISGSKTFELQNRIFQTNSNLTNGTYWSVGNNVNCHLSIWKVS